MDTLTKLAIKYGADKWGKHKYTPYYYEQFKKIRMRVKKVIEIGTGEGASILMWHDFFPNAQIYGVDIDPKRVTIEPKYPRITIMGVDQSKLDDLINVVNETGSDVDIVIDDGSHIPAHQVFSCRALMYALDNPLYYIEDVADENVAHELSNKDWEFEITKFSPRYDDRIVHVWKK